MFLQRCNSNTFWCGTVWWVKLKLTGFVVRDVGQTKRKYLHPNTNASTQTTTTVTILTTSFTTTATKS